MTFPNLDYPTLELWEILSEAVKINRNPDEERELSQAVAENLDMAIETVQGVFEGHFLGKQCIGVDSDTGTYAFVDDKAPDAVMRTIAVWMALPMFEAEYTAKHGQEAWDQKFGMNGGAAVPQPMA